MKKQLLSLTEVAAKLKVSRQRVLQWVKDKRIPYQRIGHQYAIKAEDCKRPKAGRRGPKPKKDPENAG